MIEEITIYRTSDRSEFRNRADAEAYEARAIRVAAIMAPLPVVPPGTDFTNGNGYIQHDWSVANRVALRLLDLIEEVTGPHTWIDQTRSKGLQDAHPSYVERLIGDFNDRALQKAWSRMSHIDWKTMREYGQQYYANNPDKATGGRIN